MSFETITVVTDGEEEKGNLKEKTKEELSNIEKINIQGLRDRINEGMIKLEESISNLSNLDASKKFDNKLLVDVLSRVRPLITRSELENSKKNTKEGLPEYFKFRKALDMFGGELKKFQEEVRGKAMITGITKGELQDKFSNFLVEPLADLQKSMDNLVPEAKA